MADIEEKETIDNEEVEEEEEEEEEDEEEGETGDTQFVTFHIVFNLSLIIGFLFLISCNSQKKRK